MRRETDRQAALSLIHLRESRPMRLDPPPVRKRRSMARRAWIAALEALGRVIK